MTFPNGNFCGLGSLQDFFFPVLISSIFSKCFTGNKKGFARLMCCENTVNSSLFTLIQETRQKNIISICNAVQQRNRHSNF